MPRLPIVILLLSCCRLSAYAQLSGDFLAAPASGCGPLVVVFGSQVTAPGPASWFWDLGNGNTSTYATPRAIYSTPGVYTVTMTVTSGSQTITATHTVTVYPSPSPSIGIPVTKVCGAEPVTFNVSAGGAGGASYLWDFGDGSTSTVSSGSTTHAYPAQGVYGISLTETDSHGCVATVVQPNAVTVVAPLTPSFSTNPKVLCTVNSPVSFTNSSTGPGVLSYQWNFGDGNGSTQTGPSYTYSAKGTYTVVLTVTSTEGCVASDTQTNVLNVADYHTNFSAPSAVCQGNVVTMSDASTPTPGSYSWTVDGSKAGTLKDLAFSSNTVGNHTVMLTNTYGACTQSTTQTVMVNATPVIPAFDAVVQGVCGAPGVVKFLDHTPGATGWTWAFIYNPYLTVQNTVSGGPANTFTYPYDGTFEVQLTVTNGAGCVASVMQPVNIQAPVVNIIETDNTPEGSCGPPLTKSFSCPQLANLASYVWNFGDGTSSTVATPTHTFSGAGAYNTSLTWTDKNGCTGTTNSIPTLISSPPNLNFTANTTTVCAGQPLSFTVPSQFSNAWVGWFFGDGGEDPFTDGNVVYTYTTPGVYSVTLNVDEFTGCNFSNTLTSYITVLPSPTLSFTTANTCDSPRANVTFTVTAGNGATGIQWQFGDGATLNTAANITTLTHTYFQNGYYNVIGTATNGTCTTATGKAAIVELKPLDFHLGLTTTAICPAVFVGDTLIKTYPPGAGNDAYAYTNVQWYYGDGTPFLGPQNWVFIGNDYNSQLSGFQPGESGLYAITTNILNCKDTTNVVPFTVGGITAAYQVVQDGQCYQQPVLLQDVSVTAPGDPTVSRLWDFGDGVTQQASSNVQHFYANPGTYTVRLTVTDQFGCPSTTNTAVRQVTVLGPRASFQAAGGATVFPQGLPVQFVNNSNTANTTNPVYSWNFGDGTSSTLASPSHLYATPGVYTVTLTAQDGAGGCVSTMSLVITIQPVNNAFSTTTSYVASGSCPPVLVHFTNLSVNYASFTWDFGDGETVSNVPNPSHVYQSPGRYLVTLTVLGNNGQTTTTVDSVVVVQPGTVLSATAPAVCLGQPVTLQSTGNVRVKGYTWDFGDGAVAGTTDSAASHVYTKAGTYSAKLVVADSLGCMVAAAATDAIDVLPPPVIVLTPTAAMVCLGQGVTLKATGGITYSWSPGPSLSDSTVSTPVAMPVVNTQYKVTVADDIGCTNTDSMVVRVVRPDSVRVVPDSATVCPGQPVQLTATGAYSYRWIGVVEGLSGTGVPNPVARPSVTTTFLVVGSDSAGCFRDTVPVIVTLLEQPTVNAGPDESVLAGTPVTLAAVGSSDVVSWLWSPATDLNCTGCAQPICTPTQTRQYTVLVTAADGCTALDTVVVKLICDETRVRIPEAFTPNGDGHNDRFVILGIGAVDHLVIYDRWGVKVFERNHFYTGDIDAQWDGSMEGQPAPAGVYAYFVEMTCPTGERFTRKGTVVLVR